MDADVLIDHHHHGSSSSELDWIKSLRHLTYVWRFPEGDLDLLFGRSSRPRDPRIRVGPSRLVTDSATRFASEALQLGLDRGVLILRIRRGDRVRDCDTSVPRILREAKRYIERQQGNTAAAHGFTLLWASDETNAKYATSLNSGLLTITGVKTALRLDPLLARFFPDDNHLGFSVILQLCERFPSMHFHMFYRGPCCRTAPHHNDLPSGRGQHPHEHPNRSNSLWCPLPNGREPIWAQTS
eukprot:2152488-Prymnesium_polylepis.2